jgi:hypothetical protein
VYVTAPAYKKALLVGLLKQMRRATYERAMLQALRRRATSLLSIRRLRS